MADTQFSPKPFNASNIHGGLKFPDTKSPLLPSDVNNIVEMLYGVSNSASYAASVANITSSNGAEIKFDTSNKTITFEQGLRFFSKKFDYTVENDRILTLTEENQHYVVMFNTEDNTISSTPLNNYRDSQYSSDKYAYLFAVYFDGNEVYTDLKFPYNKIQKIKDNVEEIKVDVEEIKVLFDLKEGTEGLEYTDNGDGTCSVVGIGTDTADIVIPIFHNNKKVTSIGKLAFRDKKIKSIIISSSINKIENSAFLRCSNLQTVTFAENSQLTTVDASAFLGCSKLTSIKIPSSVQEIGNDAFSTCSSLQNVTFAENSQLSTIGEWAFNNCTSLTSITIPNKATSIGEYAFFGCQSLKIVFIPKSVTTIGRLSSSTPELTVYTEWEFKPDGWSDDFNYDSIPVIWGVDLKENLTEVSVDIHELNADITELNEKVDSLESEQQASVVNITSIDEVYENVLALPTTGVENGTTYLVANASVQELYSYNGTTSEWVKKDDLKPHTLYTVLTGVKKGIYRYTMSYPYLVLAEQDATNALKNTVYGATVKIEDVSPFTHTMSVKLKSNILPYPYYHGNERVTGGITFTQNADQSVTINGKATSNAGYFVYSGAFPFEVGETYYIRLFSSTKNSNVRFIAEWYNPDYVGGTNAALSGGDAISWTVKNDYTQYNILIQVLSGTTLSNFTVYPTIYKGTPPTKHTPYITDFSGFTLRRYGKTENDFLRTYTAESDGTIKVGVTSLYPIVNLVPDSDSVEVEVEYSQEINEGLKKRYVAIQENTAGLYQAYCNNTSGGQEMLSVNPIAGSWSIARRYTDGRLRVGTAVENTDAVPLGQADDRYVPVLTTTDGDRVYVSKEGGGTGLMQIQYGSPISWTIPARIEGGIVRVGTPVGDTDATNKKFVVDGFEPKLTTTEVYWSTVEAAGEYIVTDGEYAFGFGDTDTPSNGRIRFDDIFDTVIWKGGKPAYITISGDEEEGWFNDGVILTFSDSIQNDTVILKFRTLPCLYGASRLLIEVI